MGNPSIAAEPLTNPIEEQKIIESTQSEMPTEVSVEITADEISYNDEQSLYEANGNAVAFLKEKNATLKADQIIYNAEKHLLEALGEVSITQNANIIYGTYASFETTEEKYNINDPRLFLEKLKIKARTGESLDPHKKKKSGEDKTDILFKTGVLALQTPITLYSPGHFLMTKYSLDEYYTQSRRIVNWEDLRDKSSFKYTAKEIFYDDTRKTQNLRITGARVWINDKLSIPYPIQITTTVGEAAQTKFKGPVIGTRERLGGFLLGPRYYYSVESGTFSFVPLVQIGNGPKFGGGGLISFNTPADRTAISAGYGTLYNRFTGSLHHEIRNYAVDALYNQFYRNSIFGASQVGQSYELTANHSLFLPFVDQRGLILKSAVGYVKDNVELFTNKSREIFAEEIDKQDVNDDHAGFRSAIEGMAYSQPIWRAGHEFRNIGLRAKGQGAFRYYGTGDTLSIARGGPALEARFQNLSFEIDYLLGYIKGESPFVFDQFIDGSQSILFDGDYKVNRWFSIGTLLTYNLTNSLFVRNQIRTEFGPEDFKLRLSYDTILNQVYFGFNTIFGDPIQYEKLKVRI